MGIDINECKEVAKLLGMKIFVSELFAYQELGNSIKAGLSVSKLVMFCVDLLPKYSYSIVASK